MDTNIIEQWLPMVYHEESYEVSNLGRIRSIDRITVYRNGKKVLHNGKILSQSKNMKGYCVFQLWENNKRTLKTVHRLVAIAWIPNPHSLLQINHINGDKSDNRIENLEWISNKDNYEHAIANSLRGVKAPRAVNQLTKEGLFIKRWERICFAETELKVSQSHISAVCRGTRHTCGGFKWEYADSIKKD